MSSYAIYRLPHQDHCTMLMQSHGNPLVIDSITDLKGKEGFVMAPFEQSENSPLLLLVPDRVETLNIPEDDKDLCPFSPDVTWPVLAEERNAYASDFSKFHSRLNDGTFRKIVLSRCAHLHTEKTIAPEDFFMKACRMYPRMFVALVSSELSGTWLMATPEILLDGDGCQWHTMALAGTMKLEGNELSTEGENMMWSSKNIQEQRYVASYITECLKPFVDDFVEEGPRTVRAADLVHLRSDFTFKLKSADMVSEVLNILHPTPAVCGLPKAAARRFILDNEHSPRKYYSGFMGTLYPGHNTHLYVTLRCMQIHDKVYDLYAGGGLLKESTEESEWGETENKLNTMRRLIPQLSKMAE
jgi:isochorismate synthase